MSLGAGRWLAVCLLVGAFGAFAVPQAAGVTAVTRYVVSTGADADNDCTDSANPCASLQHAIDQASAGDAIDVAGTIESHVTIPTPLTVTQWPGQAPAVLDGTNSGTVVKIDGGGASTPPPVTLSDLTIENGNSSSNGGGVLNVNGALTVDNATFSDNSGSGGGAIASEGLLSVEDSTFSNNSSDFGGGAILDAGAMSVDDSTFSANSSTGQGGGAILELGSGTVLRSTLVGNSTVGGDGGGVLVFVLPNGPATAPKLLVAGSTFSGNSATGGGGAIANNGSITVESSTLTGNSAAVGSTIASANRNVLFAADIFAKPATGTNCSFKVSPIGGVDAGYNIDDDGSCGLSAANQSVSASSAIGPYLGSVADNGGPTQTVALLNTPSAATTQADPAVAAVPRSFHLPQAVDGKIAACAVPDQRGILPAVGIRCDVGAYLLQRTRTTLTASSRSVQPGGSVTYTATVTPAPDGGTVTFSDGTRTPATLTCAARPLTAATAACTVSYPRLAALSVTAAYSGDGASNNDAPSLSNPLGEAVVDAEPPSAPRALTGRIANNALSLSWRASSDNIGVDHYEVYLGTTRVGTITGTTTQTTVGTFRQDRASVFTVRAFDEAGNWSGASNAVIAKPVPRPRRVPKHTPRWAWRLLAWQTHQVGARPRTPHPLPHWYAAWKRWRGELFRLVG